MSESDEDKPSESISEDSEELVSEEDDAADTNVGNGAWSSLSERELRELAAGTITPLPCDFFLPLSFDSAFLFNGWLLLLRIAEGVDEAVNGLRSGGAWVRSVVVEWLAANAAFAASRAATTAFGGRPRRLGTAGLRE